MSVALNSDAQSREIGHVPYHNLVLTIMSSSEGDSDTEHNVGTVDQKARNIQRACDVCRRKKSGLRGLLSMTFMAVR
jgi:hypothetical protein